MNAFPASRAALSLSGSAARPVGPGPIVLSLLLFLALCAAPSRPDAGEPPARESDMVSSPDRISRWVAGPAERAAAAEEDGEGGWDDEAWDDEAGGSRTFLYKEVVTSGFYSPVGKRFVPPEDRTKDHWEFSPRAPGNYAGVDYIQTFTASSFFNKKLLPKGMRLTAVDLHPLVQFYRMEWGGSWWSQFKFVAQDFWARFTLAGKDRLTLRLGQFAIPYGVNPVVAPRQRFMMPIEAVDLGFKWDWGVHLKGPAGAFDWEVAATIGTGESLRSPHFLDDRKRSWLISGRIGAPTYWDVQYGLSFLYGDLPDIQGAKVWSPTALSRWRVGVDGFYKRGTFLTMGGQVTYGQDGFLGDEMFVGVTGGNTATVLGGRGWVNWLLPWYYDLKFGAQFESFFQDLEIWDTNDTAIILETGYSLTTGITILLDYRKELDTSDMGDKDNAVFFSIVYYSQ